MKEINWPLLNELATKPHKHLNIVEEADYGLMVDGQFDTGNNGVGEVMQEARTVQHLCDLVGISEGHGDDAHIDARVYRLLREVLDLRERLDRLASWHSRETGLHGMVGDFCVNCGNRWPCETRRMADGTYDDTGPTDAEWTAMYDKHFPGDPHMDEDSA